MIYTDFGPMGDELYLADSRLEAAGVAYNAFMRTLSKNPVPKSLTFPDLQSPYDNKPLICHFDGRQITITVSCPDKAINLKPLKLPTDAMLATAT